MSHRAANVRWDKGGSCWSKMENPSHRDVPQQQEREQINKWWISGRDISVKTKLCQTQKSRLVWATPACNGPFPRQFIHFESRSIYNKSISKWLEFNTERTKAIKLQKLANWQIGRQQYWFVFTPKINKQITMKLGVKWDVGQGRIFWCWTGSGEHPDFFFSNARYGVLLKIINYSPEKHKC